LALVVVYTRGSSSIMCQTNSMYKITLGLVVLWVGCHMRMASYCVVLLAWQMWHVLVQRVSLLYDVH
jgi:hypothetical protein